MTTAARAALNTANQFIEQERKKLAELEKQISKISDDAQLNIKRNEIAALKKTIETFEGKRAQLIGAYPELDKPETFSDRISKLFGKSPVVASRQVARQPSKEEINGFDASDSPRNSSSSIADKDQVTSSTPLLSNKI